MGMQKFKRELDYNEDIIERLIEAYIDPKNRSAWVVAFSNGKDSSCMGYLIWKAVERVPGHLRHRMVYFATTDTLLEHPEMKKLMRFSCQQINEVAKANQLPIQAVLVQPEMTAMMKMLGHGNPLPTAIAGVNRWCTDVLKLKPMKKLQDQLIEKHGSIVLMLGIRWAESKKRAKSIKKYGEKGEFIFPMKGEQPQKDGKHLRYACYPIVHLSDKEVWQTIYYAEELPWKVRATTIRNMYEKAGKYPIEKETLESFHEGTSRNGCILCMKGAREKDKMLQTFIKNGEEWAVHVDRLRQLIRESLYDIRLRKPIHHWRKQKLNWANPFIEDYQEKQARWRTAKRRKASREAFFKEEEKRKRIFREQSEGLCHHTQPVYPYLANGGYTLQARIMLLKAVRYTEEKAGMELISPKELAYIKKIWKEECGWEENIEDLRPEFPDYEGALVLNPDYTVNVEDDYGLVTTIPNLTIYADGVNEETGETIIPLPVDYRKKNPPKRKNKRNKMTKKEAIAEHNLPKAKTVNVNPNIKKRHSVFYVERDWGGDEASIMEHLERSSFKSKQYIPYYWFPSFQLEKKRDCPFSSSPSRLVYWNTVVFIVCLPHIQTRKEAIRYVDWYIQQGEKRKSYFELLEENVRRSYERYLSMEPAVAKREILRQTEDPDDLPDDIKEYANVTDEELTIARVMRYEHRHQEKVSLYCQGETWKKVGELLVEGLSIHEARKLLITRGYPPHVLPGSVFIKAGIGNLFLKKAHRYKMKGVVGNDLIKKFPLSFWVKGMTYRDACQFILRTGYRVDEVKEELLLSIIKKDKNKKNSI